MWRRTVVGAAIFTLIYLAYFLTLVMAHPGYVAAVWNLEALSGRLVLGIPIEELLFAASLGAAWSGFYEHRTWRMADGYAPA